MVGVGGGGLHDVVDELRLDLKSLRLERVGGGWR